MEHGSDRPTSGKVGAANFARTEFTEVPSNENFDSSAVHRPFIAAAFLVARLLDSRDYTEPRDGWLKPLYVLAITAGSRQGELLGPKWEDVDLENGTLQARRTLSNGTFTAPKTAKSRRSAKLTTRALQSPKHHRQRQLDERVARKETDPGI